MSYSIRVELHNGSWENYVDLAADLARKGVVDTIRSDDGTIYKLPPAEYTYEGTGSIDDVLSGVRASANITGKSNAVFVTEAARRKWIGLPTV